MIFIRFLIILLSSSLLISCGNKEYLPIEVMASGFGLYAKDADGKITFTEANVVPKKNGQSYGWILRYRGNQDEIKFHEVIVLEKKTKWGTSHKEIDGRPVQYEEILEGRGLIVTRTIKNEGFMAGSWSMTQEDHVGKASIRVFIGKKLIKEFIFEIKDVEVESR